MDDMSVPNRIPTGGEALLGQPTQPNRALAREIAALLTQLPQVLEAHLPQCFAPDKMSRPAQVLMIVFGSAAGSEHLMSSIQASLARLLPKGTFLDVWPVPAADPFLEPVRRVGCRILIRTATGEAAIEDPWSLWNRTLRRLRRH